MKKALFFTVALSLVASSAMAVDTEGRFGLGFVMSDAPVGGRFWVNEKVGIDVGVGLAVDDNGTESLTDFMFGVGVPIVVQNIGDRVNFLVHPRFTYKSEGLSDSAPADFSSPTSIGLLAALEFEVFVTGDFAMSASHGLGIRIEDSGDPADDSTTDIATFGANMTEFGFRYYFQGN